MAGKFSGPPRPASQAEMACYPRHPQAFHQMASQAKARVTLAFRLGVDLGFPRSGLAPVARELPYLYRA